MGTIDLIGECVCDEDADGTCDYICGWAALCALRHKKIDVNPWKKCKSKYSELQCCLRSRGVPSGTPGTAITDQDLWSIYETCRNEECRWDRTYCHPPSQEGCDDPLYIPPKPPDRIYRFDTAAFGIR